MAGYPLIGVPGGNAFGLGITVIGTAFRELTLIKPGAGRDPVTG